MFIINEFQIFNSWIFQSFSKHFSGRREYRWLSGKESTCQVADGVQSLGWEDPLEVEMATHSSILASEFPWQAAVHGVTKVGHDLGLNNNNRLESQTTWDLFFLSPPFNEVIS